MLWIEKTKKEYIVRKELFTVVYAIAMLSALYNRLHMLFIINAVCLLLTIKVVSSLEQEEIQRKNRIYKVLGE